MSSLLPLLQHDESAIQTVQHPPKPLGEFHTESQTSVKPGNSRAWNIRTPTAKFPMRGAAFASIRNNWALSETKTYFFFERKLESCVLHYWKCHTSTASEHLCDHTQSVFFPKKSFLLHAWFLQAAPFSVSSALLWHLKRTKQNYTQSPWDQTWKCELLFFNSARFIRHSPYYVASTTSTPVYSSLSPNPIFLKVPYIIEQQQFITAKVHTAEVGSDIYNTVLRRLIIWKLFGEDLL